MSFVIVATTLAVVSTAVTVDTQLKSAKAQEIEFEKQAEEEKSSAEGRELQRRQQLNKVLAANAVSLATSGISGEGTPQSISLESAKQASISEGVESLSDRLRQAQLRRQGRNARSLGRAQAASTLLSSASKVAAILG